MSARIFTREKQVVRLSRLTRRVLFLRQQDNCLERSLIAYRHLSDENANPLLVVGARQGRALRATDGFWWTANRYTTRPRR